MVWGGQRSSSTHPNTQHKHTCVRTHKNTNTRVCAHTKTQTHITHVPHTHMYTATHAHTCTHMKHRKCGMRKRILRDEGRVRHKQRQQTRVTLFGLCSNVRISSMFNSASPDISSRAARDTKVLHSHFCVSKHVFAAPHAFLNRVARLKSSSSKGKVKVHF